MTTMPSSEQPVLGFPDSRHASEAGLKSGPVLVELFGQPGAGKTTLALAAMSGTELRTRANVGTAWRGLPKIAKLGFFARALGDGLCVAHAIRLVWSARLYNRDSLARLVRLLVKSHWMRAQSGQLLLNEGCLQDLWSIYYSNDRGDPDPCRVAPLIRRLYRGVSACIVYVDVDPSVAFERIVSRSHGRSRLDRLAEADLRQHLLDAANISPRLVEASLLAGLRVETVDASQSIETSLRNFRAAVKAFESSRHAGGLQMA